MHLFPQYKDYLSNARESGFPLPEPGMTGTTRHPYSEE